MVPESGALYLPRGARSDVNGVRTRNRKKAELKLLSMLINAQTATSALKSALPMPLTPLPKSVITLFALPVERVLKFVKMMPEKW